MINHGLFTADSPVVKHGSWQLSHYAHVPGEGYVELTVFFDGFGPVKDSVNFDSDMWTHVLLDVDDDWTRFSDAVGDEVPLEVKAYAAELQGL